LLNKCIEGGRRFYQKFFPLQLKIRNMRILFCILVLYGNLKAQDYFYKLSPVTGDATNYQILESNGRFFVTLTSCFDQGAYCGYVCEIDHFGNVIWKSFIPMTDVAHASSCIYNDTIYLAGNGTPNNNRSIIHKISVDGKIISTHDLIDSEKLYSYFNIANLSKFQDKFILTGQCFIDGKSKGIIMSIDEAMKIDTIIIDTTLEISTIWDDFVGSDSIFTCFYYQVNKFWPNQVRRIIKYDADFNQVWSYTSDTLGVNTSFPNGTVLRDGRIAFVDFKPLQSTGLNSLRCLDTITKKNDWMFSYQNVPSWGRNLYTVKQLKNGDIICTGKYITKATAPRIEGSPYMMRVDSTGKLQWERSYVEIAPDGEDKGGSLWDVIELDNGDLMAVGFVTNDRKWDPLIIRTDHRGCMDGGNTNCPTVKIIDLTSGTEDEIKSSKSLQIYPNPGVDHLRIDVTDEMLFPLRYELSGVSGQRVTIGYHNSGDNLIIDTSLVPIGMYFIRLVDKSGKIWQGKWVKM
jgi:hypothetical protein